MRTARPRPRPFPLRSIAPLAIPVALLLGCASSPTSGPRGGEGAPARPGDVETVILVGINDVHGALAPVQARTRDAAGIEALDYVRGGGAMFAAHVEALRAEHGAERVLLVDAGDCLQGALESNREEGAPVIRYFNEVGVRAAAIGNHEFDFGPAGEDLPGGNPLGALEARMREAKYPFVAANIADRETGELHRFPNTVPRLIVPVGRVKVGIVGLSTLETPVTTRTEFVRHLDFTALAAATVREAAALRREGAHVVVVVAHVGLQCDDGLGIDATRLRGLDGPQEGCGEDGEMVRLLRALPQGTVDAVVSGHSHTVVHHWVSGIPVIQGGTRLRYYNAIHLPVDVGTGKLLKDRVVIEGPMPICEKVFAATGDCDGQVPPPAGGWGGLVPATFRGRPIAPDPEMTAFLQPVLAAAEAEGNRVVGQAARAVDHFRFRESPLGNLVADILRKETGADVGLVNGGGIRAPFEPGEITFAELYRTFPFENRVAVVEVTGQQLLEVIRISTSGSRGYAPFSGLRARVLDHESAAPWDDLDGDGIRDPWEMKRLLSLTFDDGRPVDPAATYRLALPDFLVTGGDDYGWAFERIAKEKVTFGGPVMRELIEHHLKEAGPLNPPEKPLVDPAAPRLVVVKSAGAE